MTDALNPHIAFPFRLRANGKELVHHEQGSDDEIVDCVEVLLRTPAGSRLEAPEYGTPAPEFSQNVDLNAIQVAIERWEPRAIAALEGRLDDADSLIHRLRVTVEGRGSNA